ncbi:hypothetical protein CISIN_1g028198mg [Citrus sinensis]|nr:hypothetical protein CISIN_1g028198mg [Citrus sinensis]
MEISSKNNEIVDVSYVDDECSEQSWMLRSLSESTVACITGDYAMQNVILQMGLRLLAPGGMQIRQLHRYIVDKCLKLFSSPFPLVICIKSNHEIRISPVFMLILICLYIQVDTEMPCLLHYHC